MWIQFKLSVYVPMLSQCTSGWFRGPGVVYTLQFVTGMIHAPAPISYVLLANGFCGSSRKMPPILREEAVL